MVYSGTRSHPAASRKRAKTGRGPSSLRSCSRPGHRSRIRSGVRKRSSTADSPEQGRSMTPKRAVAILIVVSALVRLVTASCLGLGNDEAYHFLYSVHPDLSYYDHPPMLAWVEAIGLTVSGATFSAVALRLVLTALSRGAWWLMWRIAPRWYGPRAGFYAPLALTLPAYYGLAASTFALPDGPRLFFCCSPST